MALAVLEANLTALAFTSPFVGPNGWDLLRYNVGEKVNVSWTTPWELTTLEVWRASNDDGQFALDVLAANLTQETTSFIWSASTLGGDNVTESLFLRLQKSVAPNTCDKCTADSATFRVSNPNARPLSSSTASMSSTATPTPAAEAASASPSSPSSGLSESTRLGLGLGIGLGVGLSVLLALGIILFCLHRRKKRQHANPPTSDRPDEGRTSYASAGADSWMSKHSSKMSYHSRFEFETPDGYIKEGSEALWPRTEKPSWLQRAPSKPKIPFFRS